MVSDSRTVPPSIVLWRDSCRSPLPLPEAALEATQEQNDSFFSQLPDKCYLEEVASVGG